MSTHSMSDQQFIKVAHLLQMGVSTTMSLRDTETGAHETVNLDELGTAMEQMYEELQASDELITDMRRDNERLMKKNSDMVTELRRYQHFELYMEVLRSYMQRIQSKIDNAMYATKTDVASDLMRIAALSNASAHFGNDALVRIYKEAFKEMESLADALYLIYRVAD